MSKSPNGPPDWFVSGKHSKYSSELYLVGIGSGENHDAAIAVASDQVARQIEVIIDSEIKNTISSQEISESETISYDYQAVSKSVAKGSLTGAEVVEKTEAGGKFYALVVIEKSNYARGIQTELDQLAQSLSSQYTNADNMLNSGDVIGAMKTLQNTVEEANAYFAKATLMANLTGRAAFPEIVYSAGSIESRIRNIASELSLKTVSGYNQSAKSGEAFAEPLIVRLTHGDRTVQNIQLKLTDRKKETLAKLPTDTNGEAAFRTHALGAGHINFIVRYDLTDFPTPAADVLRNASCIFPMIVEPANPLDIAIEVYDANSGNTRLTDVETKFGQAVSRIGHKVSSQGEYLLKGKVIVGNQKEIESLGRKQYLTEVLLELKMLEQSSGKQVGALTLNANGLDHNSLERAVVKAYSNLNISEDELAKLFAEIQNR
ncbi:LPP20 family lipoprotein [Calditrichota bacterium]